MSDITTPMPEPAPEDIERSLAAMEAYANNAPRVRWRDLLKMREACESCRRSDGYHDLNCPTLVQAAPAEVEQAPQVEPAEDEPQDDPAPLVDAPEGETKRVKALRAEVAEARLLGELQEDPAPLLVDTDRVRKRRKKAGEAARLHQLGQDPTMRAWQAARMRRLLVVGGMVSLTLALGWSTAGVQGFAAEGADMWSPGWVLAWLVEPFLSLALLVVVGAKAYMGTRGQPIESPTLTKIELMFLGLTLGMNAWPHLPGVADEFTVSGLVLHILGPVVAVAIVTALPIVLAAFADLDHGATGRGATAPKYSGNARAEVDRIAALVRQRIADGDLPADVSATAIRKAFGCGTDTARAVRDAITK